MSDQTQPTDTDALIARIEAGINKIATDHDMLARIAVLEGQVADLRRACGLRD